VRPAVGPAQRARMHQGITPVALASPLLALEFLTVLRVRRPPLTDETALARAQIWYPAVGLCIGLLVAGIDRMMAPLLPRATEAVLLLVVWEGITGLLHLDGLADAADGLLGLHSREQRLEIMRDSRVGSFGAASLVFYLLLSYGAIAALRGPARTPLLIIAPLVGRAAMVAVLSVFGYARPDGLAAGFHAAARGWPGVLALASGCLLAALLLGWGGLLLLAAGIAVSLGAGAFAAARIGGMTGDVVGAACELAQLTVLVVAGGLQSGTWFRPWL